MPALRLALAALLAAPVALAQPQWAELAASPYNGYRSEDISFVDAERGWAVDGLGRVHRTLDGGATWGHTTNLDGYLRATAFVSPEVGWVGTVNSSPTLYETRDGGLTFTDVSARVSPRTHGVCSLFAVSDQVVFGAGTYNGPATLVNTFDGGQTWTARPIEPLDTVIDVYFFDALHGLAVGGVGTFPGAIRPRVVETRNAGSTWTVRHTSDATTAGWGWKISFPTPDVGYVSVEKIDRAPDAVVLKTTDGGQSWTELTVPGGGTTGGDMQGIGFVTADVGWISGRGVTSVTTDGGATWAPVPLGQGLDPHVNRFRFLDGVAFASGHKIHRLETAGVATEGGPLASAVLGVDPNPARTAVRVRYRPAPGPATVEVFDALGRRVGAVGEAAADGEAEWRIPAALPAGVYTARVRTVAGEGTAAFSVVR